MEDELRDRFGPLPWQVQNLLYVVKLKLLARGAELEGIVREDGRIVLRVNGDIGGAKRALQRVLGGDVEIGNTQIRLPLDNLTEEWEKPLAELVQKLSDFMTQMASAGAKAVGV